MSNTVESKYKNPDRMIARLQKRNKELHRALDSAFRGQRKIEGNQVVSWCKTAKSNKGLTGIDLGEFNVGDTVITIGQITKVTTEKLPYNNNSSYIYYRVLETRRRPR